MQDDEMSMEEIARRIPEIPEFVESMRNAENARAEGRTTPLERASETLDAMDREKLFTGYEPRECGEHRTVGPHRAWCFDCSEWCYPGGDGACKGCRVSTIPPGMTPEKLEKVADYVSLLDRMDIDLEANTVTFGPARTDETEMQDDLRAWASWLRRKEEGR